MFANISLGTALLVLHISLCVSLPFIRRGMKYTEVPFIQITLRQYLGDRMIVEVLCTLFRFIKYEKFLI